MDRLQMLLGPSRFIRLTRFCFPYLDHAISMKLIVTKKRAQIHLREVNQCHEMTHRFSFKDTATNDSPPSETTRLDYGVLLRSCRIEWGIIGSSDCISEGSLNGHAI